MDVDVRIEIDQPVHDGGGEVLGHVTGVVAPPSLHQVTHVVVSDRDGRPSRLVPLDDLRDEGGQLVLDTPRWPDDYELAEEMDLVALNERLQRDLSLAFPLGDVWIFPHLSLPGGHRRLVHEHLPEGEIAITSGSRVVGTDGPVGRVAGLLVDPTADEITHLLVRHGHLWRRRALAVPVDLVERVEGSEVVVQATSGDLEEHVVPE